MSIYPEQIQSFSSIYPGHIWINLDIDNSRSDLSQSELELICIKEVRKYLTESLKLVIETPFPTNIPFVSQLINGFVLSISGIKVAFLPSRDLDLMGFEVPQEWVQLSNWAADYYVPIQIDLEDNCLHLWGFISHQHLQQRANLDRTFRSYEVEGGDLINDLDSLWMACESVAEGKLAAERGKISNLPELSNPDAKILIDRLQQHQSVFSPRLSLPFEQWGAIINSPEHLNQYANPIPKLVKIGTWFLETIDSLGSKVETATWQTIEEFCYQPAPLPGFLAAKDELLSNFVLTDIPLTTPAQIRFAVDNLYKHQKSATKVDLPADIDSSELLLVYLIQRTTDQTLRWKAAEYLWTISPDRNQNWQRRIKDLGSIQGHKLGLMIAAIPLLDGRYAVLNRVYSIDSNSLPANVQLTLFSEDNQQLYQTNRSSIAQYDYTQLYFIASAGKGFNIEVSIESNQHSVNHHDRITESFII